MIYILIIFCLCGGYIMGVLTVCMLQGHKEYEESFANPRIHCANCGKDNVQVNLVDGKSVCGRCGRENLSVHVRYTLRDVPEPNELLLPL